MYRHTAASSRQLNKGLCFVAPLLAHLSTVGITSLFLAIRWNYISVKISCMVEIENYQTSLCRNAIRLVKLFSM
jgi:hypothetical protein